MVGYSGGREARNMERLLLETVVRSDTNQDRHTGMDSSREKKKLGTGARGGCTKRM